MLLVTETPIHRIKQYVFNENNQTYNKCVSSILSPDSDAAVLVEDTSLGNVINLNFFICQSKCHKIKAPVFSL